MRTVFIAICTLAAASSFNPAHAQKLYAFLVADTNNESAGGAFCANYKMMKKLVEEVDQVDKDDTNVELEKVIGAQFNCRTIAARLNKYRITRNDAVLFYYTGQGFRGPGKLPEFDCRRSWQDRNRVGLASVVAHFARAKPRLIVAMADAGNKRQSKRSGELKDDAAGFFGLRELPPDRVQLLQKLFWEGKGVHKLTAAKTGEEAHFIVIKERGKKKNKNNKNKDAKCSDEDEDEKDLGGYFTNQFLAVLFTQSVAEVTWEKVLKAAARPIPLPQEPAPMQTPYVDSAKPRN